MYKGKGDWCECTSLRGIILQKVINKVYCRVQKKKRCERVQKVLFARSMMALEEEGFVWTRFAVWTRCLL